MGIPTKQNKHKRRKTYMGKKRQTPKQVLELRLRFMAEVCAKEGIIKRDARYIEDLCGTAHLIMLSIIKDSKVEVFHDNSFWEVTVKSKVDDGFHFTYDGSDHESGFVYFDDFLTKWRLPNDGKQTHLTAINLQLMRDQYTPLHND